MFSAGFPTPLKGPMMRFDDVLKRKSRKGESSGMDVYMFLN
jgi:hypothetical protein